MGSPGRLLGYFSVFSSTPENNNYIGFPGAGALFQTFSGERARIFGRGFYKVLFFVI